MEVHARRRPSNSNASASASTSRLQRESSSHVKASLRSPSMGSATPKLEDDDDDTPRRNTRRRNPLPPTSGPLFPPLPPKQPKNSPKNSPHASSRSPAGRAPSISATGTSSALAQVLDIKSSPLDNVDPALLEEDAISARSRSASPEKPTLPSVSNTSLTPPPTSEDAAMDVDVPMEAPNDLERTIDEEGGQNGGDDWDEYRRHRAVRGFGVANMEVKKEPETDASLDPAAVEETNAEGAAAENDEETPVKTRNAKAALRALAPGGSRSGTPSASTPGSERAGSAPRGRKRRGEGQLLLDDHLLPADIRQVHTKKAKTSERDDEDEWPIQIESDEEEDEVAVEEEEAGEQAVFDEEEGKDITRCVCKREDIDVMMIQCDECNVWQHGECMGIWGDEEAPDEYFCEECKPERHQPLKKYLRSRGRNPAMFIAPTPNDLDRFHNDRDKYPPSQSKRWADLVVAEPSPLPKPIHRHSAKKDRQLSPEEVIQDGRRSTRGRLVSKGRHEKPISSKYESSGESGREGKRHSAAPTSAHAHKRSLGGVQSISPDRSLSPHNNKLPNRRSTMNSRDAAFEEEVKAALEASRREMLGLPEEEIDEHALITEERGEKRRRGEDDEEEKELERDRAKKGKRKKDDDERADSSEPHGKPKHPNQYTYRPKPPSTSQAPTAAAAAASPVRRVVQGSTPAPPIPSIAPPAPIAGPAHHEHGTRRAGALANVPVVYHPLSQETANNLHWHLPEYLSAFADVLPCPNPLALEVRAPRTLSYLPRNHFHNQRYGPFSEDRDLDDKLVLPEEPVGREPGEPSTQLDPPTRVRYPLKRITVAEMRRRVRNVLEYVGRVQVEEGKRHERAKLLGIDVKSLSKIRREGDEDEPMLEVDHGVEVQIPTSNTEEISEPLPSESISSASAPTANQMMDEITRELISFQESFTSNGGGNGYASPIPPTISTFSNGNGNVESISVPPTPDPSAPAPAMTTDVEVDSRQIPTMEIGVEQPGDIIQKSSSPKLNGLGVGDINVDIDETTLTSTPLPIPIPVSKSEFQGEVLPIEIDNDNGIQGQHNGDGDGEGGEDEKVEVEIDLYRQDKGTISETQIISTKAEDQISASLVGVEAT